MIITEKFVFLHLPKTGGTFVTEILKKINELYPRLQVRHLNNLKHRGVKSIPSTAKGLPIVTSVRPPHHHYISRYEFKWWCRAGKKEYHPSLVRERYPNWPNLTFSEFLRYRNDWDVIPLSRFKNASRREEVRSVLKRNRIGFNSFEFLDLISFKSIDLFKNIDSLKEKEIFEIKNNITFLSQPTLSEDLYHLLLHFDIPNEIALTAKDSGKIMPKFKGANLKHKSKYSYYNEDDRSYVRDIDRILFRMFSDIIF